MNTDPTTIQESIARVTATSERLATLKERMRLVKIAAAHNVPESVILEMLKDSE